MSGEEQTLNINAPTQEEIRQREAENVAPEVNVDNLDASSGRSVYSKSQIANSLTAEDKALLDFLEEVNGMDAYSLETLAVGIQTPADFMLLPDDEEIPGVQPVDVGGAETYQKFPLKLLVKTFNLNYDVAPEGVDKDIFAMLRVEALKLGWYDRQKEVRLVHNASVDMQRFMAALKKTRNSLALYRRAAFLIPLAAEFVFRTLGHHFISGQATQYIDRYNKIFEASLTPQISNILRAEVQYHTLLHWVSPARAREVLEAQMTLGTIPDPVKLRAGAAPSGTALITTTSIILEAMQRDGIYDIIRKASALDLDLVLALNTAIKKDPVSFHKSAHAYRRAPLNEGITSRLDKGKDVCKAFAFCAQAYIDAYYKGSAISRAVALKKAADEDRPRYNRALRYFKDKTKETPANLMDVFKKYEEDPEGVNRNVAPEHTG